jgi:hypothetical protein
VELLKTLDDLLTQKAFMGFEKVNFVANGLGFGAEKGFKMIKEMRDLYDKISFYKEDGTFNLMPCPAYTTALLVKEGLQLNNTQQCIDGIRIYPIEYFNPKCYETGQIKLTDHTYSIHHYNMSWMSPQDRKWHEWKQRLY